jgi:arsenate reductase
VAEKKKTVLFLCTGNSAQSQMAEAFVRKHAGDRIQAHSAGLEPKGINPYTIRVMDEIGISLDGQTSKSVKEYLGKAHFSYFVTVCNHAEENCPQAFLLSAGRHFHWDFEDPAALKGTDEEKMAKFREVRDKVNKRI